MSSNLATSNFASISNAIGATNFKLGAWEAGTFQNSAVTNFQMGELAFYNSTVTTSDRLALETYFFEKWGITTQASNFSPSSITGLQAWYDGADPLGTGTPPANGATVSTWVDKSGNGRDATTSGGPFTAAQYVAGSPGYMYFGGSNGYGLTNSTNYMSNQYFTIFAAIRTERVANAPVVFGSWNPGPLGYVNLYVQSSQVTFDFFTGQTPLSYSPAFNGNYTQEPIRVWSCSWITSNRSVYLNGRNLGSVNSNTLLTGWNAPAIGRGTNDSYFFQGNIMEILIYTGEINNTTRSNVELYLYRKWGIDHLAVPAK
jgi:hypothetical protein